MYLPVRVIFFGANKRIRRYAGNIRAANGYAPVIVKILFTYVIYLQCLTMPTYPYFVFSIIIYPYSIGAFFYLHAYYVAGIMLNYIKIAKVKLLHTVMRLLKVAFYIFGF